ncbi:hypothetical protein C8R44DRAFT_871479 [Mycena epipterygia]|nr:hypothetical protein C8R44DRAFT_871479 [Mycena epipterygia]
MAARINCELKQRQFYCTNCIRIHYHGTAQYSRFPAADAALCGGARRLDEQVAKSTKALGAVEAARVRRAVVAQIQARVDEVLSALARLRKDNDKKRDRLRTLRQSLAERRRTLSAATALTAPPNTNLNTNATASALAALTNLSELIARARADLVQELRGAIPTHPPRITRGIALHLHLTIAPQPRADPSSRANTTSCAESAPAAETPNFTPALAMLLYNVLYLAHTQDLAIPLANAGDVLRNLWAVCWAPELGRRSHATASVTYPNNTNTGSSTTAPTSPL